MPDREGAGEPGSQASGNSLRISAFEYQFYDRRAVGQGPQSLEM